MAFVAIPQNLLGRALSEFTIKRALVSLNPGFNFDWGGRLDIWHPYRDTKQGVFFEARHICSLDRGNIPQAPIWSTITEGVRIRREDATYSELTEPGLIEEIEYLLDGSSRPNGWIYVKRQVKDRLLWIGWQASLRKILRENVPGVTAESLGRELGVTVDVLRDDVKALEVEETHTHLYSGV